MRPQTSVVFALSALAGLTQAAAAAAPRDAQPLEDRDLLSNIISEANSLVSDAISALTCSTDKLAALMKANPSLAAPFCSASVGVVIKTPTATVTTKPTR